MKENTRKCQNSFVIKTKILIVETKLRGLDKNYLEIDRD